jgi:hypothetical protein
VTNAGICCRRSRADERILALAAIATLVAVLLTVCVMIH